MIGRASMAEPAISTPLPRPDLEVSPEGADRDRREKRIHRLYGVVMRRFRRARMKRFHELFRIDAGSRVLDVGGTAYNWDLAPVWPRLTLANLGERPADLPPEVDYVRVDATDLPFADGAFDVVYSNSVIEHLGTPERQARMAREIQRVGRRYFVQTPDATFPVEPHLLTPFIHFVPPRYRARLLRNGTVWGWVTRPGRAECQAFVDEVRLLRKGELRAMFPGAAIESERILGLSKSLLALRTEEVRDA